MLGYSSASASIIENGPVELVYYILKNSHKKSMVEFRKLV